MTLLKLDDNGRLCLKGAGGIEEPVPARIVLLLLDTSGSMAGTKIEQAKDGAVDFLGSVSVEGCATALAIFGDRAAMVCDPVAESSSLRRKVARLDSGIVGEGTDLAAGLKLAAKFPDLHAVVIVTDGLPNSQSEALSAAEVLKQRGVRILCIGTDDADQAFLAQLATQSDLAIHVEPRFLRASMRDAGSLLLGRG